MRIALAAGTRPEFIQVEPIIRELIKRDLEYIFLHSGQHYDYEMDKIFFEEMDLPSPTHYLDVGSKLPGMQVGEIITKSEKIIHNEKPDVLLVTGDTNTALGVSLAANKSKVKIGHFEAGMRSFDRSMPEENNRIIIDNISHFLFSPTQKGIENLRNNGLLNNVFYVGDVMLDSIIYYQELVKKVPKTLIDQSLSKEPYLLLTLHREANTDNKVRLKNIIDALSQTSLPILFPIHPRTKQKIGNFKIKIPNNFFVISPVGYFEFLRLLSRSNKLLTDSGGAQKQAYFLAKPCITLRENTEWVETIDGGWNVLVGDNERKILDAISHFNPEGSPNLSLFGDGKSAGKIIDIVIGG